MPPPRPPHAIYVGSQVLFRSLDSGQSWETVSPDLSDAPKGAKCPGDVPVARATRCGFGTICAISPSPVADGIVWAGTDNGRVWLTRLPTGAEAELARGALVVDQVPEATTVRSRILHGASPHATAESIEPTLEDGYLWLVREPAR